MSMRDKIADRLRDLMPHCKTEQDATIGIILDDVARYVQSGGWDSVLGVPEPTIDDVARECERVGWVLSFSSSADIAFDDAEQEHHVDHIRIASEHNETRIRIRGRGCESFAYAALRTRPDKMEKPE